MSEHFVVDESGRRLWITNDAAGTLRFDHGVQGVTIKHDATCGRVMPLGDANQLPGGRL